MGPNGLPSSVSHLFLGDEFPVGDAGELSKESHLSSWPVSFSLCLLLVSLTHRRIGIYSSSKEMHSVEKSFI